MLALFCLIADYNKCSLTELVSLAILSTWKKKIRRSAFALASSVASFQQQSKLLARLVAHVISIELFVNVAMARCVGLLACPQPSAYGIHTTPLRTD